MSRVVQPVADRGVGETAVVETVPDVVVDLFGLLTHLGDPVTLLVIVAAGYLLADHLDVSRTRMAAAIGFALGGVALTLALKHAFALPRPPGAGTDGFGFPSGHAIGATVVYGSLAGLLADRRPFLTRAAAVLIVVVAASRVVIGVHYLVDVFVGIAVGVGYLALAFRLGPGWAPDRVTADAAGRTFALAVGVALAALAVTVVLDTVIAVAGAIGGWLGWRFAADRIATTTGSTSQLVLSLVVLPAVAVVGSTVVEGDVSLSLAAVLTGGIVAVLMAVPGVAALRSPTESRSSG
ncbi:phosphatase PAP2 family protein [Haloplanus aerogenes]|uniref:PAP2 superfamily protein n=1 Tax=Haloplanus aerogenes TaxID=660522 RepID=A0A3M0CW23_9EURY|nr:phosphatase PAP2 family protein [Haloplanus aerogenes]AZH27091.1 phosphatase PAP2 family protein [Haloplanus aerogenes]RMB13408.1 PAP2 superfamily protein [Haloplanus aerogenes]